MEKVTFVMFRSFLILRLHLSLRYTDNLTSNHVDFISAFSRYKHLIFEMKYSHDLYEIGWDVPTIEGCFYTK